MESNIPEKSPNRFNTFWKKHELCLKLFDLKDKQQIYNTFIGKGNSEEKMVMKIDDMEMKIDDMEMIIDDMNSTLSKWGEKGKAKRESE